MRRVRVRIRRPLPDVGYSFTLGCAFAFVAVVVLFLLWILAESGRSGVPNEPAPAVQNAPAAPVVVDRAPAAIPTRVVFVEQLATLAPPPPATATTMVIVVVEVTATPV